jgi:hypothetical protein
MKFPGNICCPKSVRADVSAAGLLTTYTAGSDRKWHRKGGRRLTRSELGRLRSALSAFNPKDLRGNKCMGPPSGDVGGETLRVGHDQSACPPKSADNVLKVMRGYLPPAT